MPTSKEKDFTPKPVKKPPECTTLSKQPTYESLLKDKGVYFERAMKEFVKLKDNPQKIGLLSYHLTHKMGQRISDIQKVIKQIENVKRKISASTSLSEEDKDYLNQLFDLFTDEHNIYLHCLNKRWREAQRYCVNILSSDRKLINEFDYAKDESHWIFLINACGIMQMLESGRTEEDIQKSKEFETISKREFLHLLKNRGYQEIFPKVIELCGRDMPLRRTFMPPSEVSAETDTSLSKLPTYDDLLGEGVYFERVMKTFLKFKQQPEKIGNISSKLMCTMREKINVIKRIIYQIDSVKRKIDTISSLTNQDKNYLNKLFSIFMDEHYFYLNCLNEEWKEAENRCQSILHEGYKFSDRFSPNNKNSQDWPLLLHACCIMQMIESRKPKEYIQKTTNFKILSDSYKDFENRDYEKIFPKIAELFDVSEPPSKKRKSNI